MELSWALKEKQKRNLSYHEREKARAGKPDLKPVIQKVSTLATALWNYGAGDWWLVFMMKIFYYFEHVTQEC